MKPAQKTFPPGHSKEKVGKETPSYALIMDNLETSLATAVSNANGNTSGAIVERLIKPIASKMCGYPVYLLDGTGPSIAVSGPHKEFFNSAFAIWIGGKNFSDGCCRPIRMHELWRDLGLIHIRVEHIYNLRQEVSMRRARVVPVKHGMSALMLALTEAEIKA